MIISFDAASSTATATWGLFIVTSMTAAFGIRLAQSAARTYELESNPVVLVRQLEQEETPPHDPARLLQTFVIDGKPILVDGIELRDLRPSDRAHPNASLSQHTLLEIQNVGRSPALEIKIPFGVSVPIISRDNPDEETGGIDTRLVEGGGNLVLPGLAANAVVFVMVDSLVGNQVTLKAAEVGTCTRIDGIKRTPHSLPIISLADIRIPRSF